MTKTQSKWGRLPKWVKILAVGAPIATAILGGAVSWKTLGGWWPKSEAAAAQEHEKIAAMSEEALERQIKSDLESAFRRLADIEIAKSRLASEGLSPSEHLIEIETEIRLQISELEAELKALRGEDDG